MMVLSMLALAMFQTSQIMSEKITSVQAGKNSLSTFAKFPDPTENQCQNSHE